MYSDIVAFWPHLYYIIQGTGVTLQYTIVSVFFGMIIGILVAICKTSDSKILSICGNSYTSVFRGTPMLLQLTIIHYGLPTLLGLKISIFVSGIIAFSLNSGAYVSEIIRAGINAVDKGQTEAAKVLGIPLVLRMKDIILPQALRNVLPALVNEIINLIKESALISTIGGMDIMRRAQAVSAETYSYFTPMITAAITYYIMVMIVSAFAKILERRIIL